MKKMSIKKFLVVIFVFMIIFFVTVNYSSLLQTEPNIIESSEFGTVDGWDFNTSRDANQYINENLTTYIRPRYFCEQDTFLLILVCSAPGNFKSRNVIRNTWGLDRIIQGKTVQVYFLLGEIYNSTIQQRIFEESSAYNDIVQERFLDTYNNLTLKSIYMLKLVTSHCKDTTKFLMKTDDDMFVNMAPLVDTLQRGNSSKVLLGCLICHAKPIKDNTNKWFTPKYMFDGKEYPNYLSGTGYVMSVDVVTKLYNAALNTPIFHLEDIYITGILAKSIRLRPRNNPGFTFTKRVFDPCVYLHAFTSHRLSPQEIYDQYTLVRAVNLTAECHAQQQQQLLARNTTSMSALSTSALNNLLRYFSSNSKPKKRKGKPTCF